MLRAFTYPSFDTAFAPSNTQDWDDGYGGYGRYFSGYGGGGGYSSGSGSYLTNYGGDWQRMFTPRGIDSPYALNGRDTFPSNPIIRRSTLRRERFSSERGRLFQWQ